VGHGEAGPLTVTDIDPEITFPTPGLFVVRLAVIPAIPQAVLGVTLPVAETTATWGMLDDQVT
jgi:hypothetical protein